MFSPLGSQRLQENLLEGKEGFPSSSSKFLRLWATVGRYWACLPRESPHPRMGPSSAHYLSNAHIPVPLLTVVSQSGEQTPPRHTQGNQRTVSEDSASHVCQTGESVFLRTQRHPQTMPLCEEAVTYGAAVAFSQLGRILICPRGRSCQQPMSCSCASLVPIVCPASPHMRKGMACAPWHHDREEMGSIVVRHHVRGLEQDEPVSLTSPRTGICGRRICPADVDRCPCTVSAP